MAGNTGRAIIAGMVAAMPLGSVAAQSLSDTVGTVQRKEVPSSFSDLSKRLMPAVVNISTSQTIAPDGLPTFPDGSPLERFNEFFGRDDDGFRRQGSLGSGFVVSANGLIVTNNHVIEGADEIEANFADGSVLKAELIGRDPDTDLAVLKVTSDTALPFVEFADSDAAEVGDWVMAIGNPFGFGGSVSAGIISARNRDIQAGRYDDFIQTDAAINRGNSGGPLFNLDGEVVGVNTAIVSPTGGSVGIGFSIPANLAKQVTGQIAEFGRPRRGWLGVNVQAIDADIARAYGVSGDDGVIITNIDPDGPAAEADLEVGDLLLSFDGRTIEDVRGLSRVVAEAPIGSAVDIELIRDRRARTATVELGELQTESEADESVPAPLSSLNDNEIGLELAEIDDEARRRFGIPRDVDGALVRSVSPRGPSFGKVVKGDVIVEIAFEAVATVSDAEAAIETAKALPDGTPALVRVSRRGQDRFFSIELD